jgi:hypothetical protein
LELGAISLFLPNAPFVWHLFADFSLASIAATITQSRDSNPLVQVMLRMVLFKLFFGMGKKKFGGPWWQHMSYLKWFLTWQPLPSPLAWYASAIPFATVVFIANSSGFWRNCRCGFITFR